MWVDLTPTPLANRARHFETVGAALKGGLRAPNATRLVLQNENVFKALLSRGIYSSNGTGLFPWYDTRFTRFLPRFLSGSTYILH